MQQRSVLKFTLVVNYPLVQLDLTDRGLLT